jgi:hypothetical protein
LGILKGDKGMIKRSEKMTLFIKSQSIKSPLSNGYWSKFILEKSIGMNELFIIGKGASAAAFGLLRKFLPNIALMSSEKQSSDYPMMRGKVEGDGLLYYLCKDYSCQAPFDSEKGLLGGLNQGN